MGKTFYYKGLRINAFGIPVSANRGVKDACRVKAKGRKRNFYLLTFKSEFNENSPRNLLLMYDIPHNKKNERDWFRRQLKTFNYIMIQKSVWVGPSPLPKDFLRYLRVVGLKSNLKTFKLAKPYTSRS